MGTKCSILTSLYCTTWLCFYFDRETNFSLFFYSRSLALRYSPRLNSTSFYTIFKPFSLCSEKETCNDDINIP